MELPETDPHLQSLSLVPVYFNIICFSVVVCPDSYVFVLGVLMLSIFFVFSAVDLKCTNRFSSFTPYVFLSCVLFYGC